MTPEELKRKFIGMQRNAPKIAREQAIQGSQRAISAILAPNMSGYTMPTEKGSKVVFRPVIGSKVNPKLSRDLSKKIQDNMKAEIKNVSQDVSQRIVK